jgi:chromosome partitioning protein
MLDIRLTLSKLSDFTQVPKKELKAMIEFNGIAPVAMAEKGDNHEYALKDIQENIDLRSALKAPKDKVINLFNLKGGVGKSTLSIHLAIGLSATGYKVLLIDLDSQRNSSGTLLSFIDQNGINTVTSYLLGGAPLKDVVKKSLPLLDVIPGPSFNEGLNLAIMANENPNKGLHLLSKMFEDNLREEYDFILIDNPPSNDAVTANSVHVSDMIVSPVEIQGFSFDGLDDTMRSSLIIEKNARMILGSKAIKKRAIINKYENRSNSHNYKLIEFIPNYKDTLYGYCVPKINGFADAIDTKNFSSLFSTAASYSVLKTLTQVILMDAVDGEFVSITSDLGKEFIDGISKKLNLGEESHV